MRLSRTLASLSLLASLTLAPGCGGAGGSAPSVTVMTRNLYYGADLADAIAAVSAGDPDLVVQAVTEVWTSVEATDFAVRAETLAAEIEAAHADLVGLQEAALWRSQTPSDAFTSDPTPAETVEFDFVEILRAALAARGLPYDVVAVSTGFDVELPRFAESLELVDVRLTDREVILARRGLADRGIALSGAEAGLFETNLVLPNGFEALRGWAAVDVDAFGWSFRFVTTHLEAEVPEVRDAQAAELLAGPLAIPGRAVLLGDLNDDADAGAATDAYADLVAAGFADGWLLAGSPGPGATCCHDALLADPGSTLTERVDLVLVRGGFTILGAEVRGEDPSDMAGGLWASDHAGLAVTLRP